MTHKKTYLLTFEGDPEAVAFLARKVDRRRPNLADAREKGRAAEVLFDVKYSVASVDVPRPRAERVRSI